MTTLQDINLFRTKLTYYKQKTIEMSEILKSSKDYRTREKAENLKNCANYFEVLNIDENKDRIKSRYCRERMCPQCMYRKSVKQYAKIIQLAENMSGSWLHCVLTVRNVEGEKLIEAVNLLHKKSTIFFKKYKQFKGIIRGTEITYNDEKNNFHPHLHCLINVNKSYFKSRYYVSQEKLLLEWQKTINDNFFKGGLYISKITNKSSSVAEVCKYCLKPLESKISQDKKLSVYETIFTALKGKRLLQTFGTCSKELKKISENYNPTKDENVLCFTRYYYKDEAYRPTSIMNNVTDELTILKK